MQDRVKITYTYCLDYIASKADKFQLTLEDLLYLSNFKWGWWTIQEPQLSLKNKLKHFSDKFHHINTTFSTKYLYQLSESEVQDLKRLSNGTLSECLYESEHKIAGIWVSYMSALLHLYFPKLLPIIDRNILLGLDIISENSIDSQWQVRNIQWFYDTLIQKIYLYQKNHPWKSIKDIDDIYFEIGQQKWKNIQKQRKNK